MGVVIVGASLSGLRAADALARSGFDGAITLVGAEKHLPYNRPPLSKEALVEGSDLETILLRSSAKSGAYELRIDTRAVAADLDRGVLELSDGGDLAFDALVVATGLRSRELEIPKPAHGVVCLRGYDDLLRLRSELAGVADIAIIGGGFIGCELAASLTSLGYRVTVIAPEKVPMLRPLGNQLGAAIQRHHEDKGVQFALSRLPIEILGTDRPNGVLCDDGTFVEAQLVIEAVGSRCNVEWLQGNGLDLSDGVLCNEKLQVVGHEFVYATGDIARFPNLVFDEVPRRVEHWEIAVASGRYAGKVLGEALQGKDASPAFAPMPAFWSDQFDLRIQSYGMPGLVQDDPSIRLLEGSLDGEVAIGYFRGEVMVGVVMLGMAQSHKTYRQILLDTLS